MQYATENIIPVTLELGGKSPNVFFPSVMDADDGISRQSYWRCCTFAPKQGEICTCPSRLLVLNLTAEQISRKSGEKELKAIKTGHPFDPTVMMGLKLLKFKR